MTIKAQIYTTQLNVITDGKVITKYDKVTACVLKSLTIASVDLNKKFWKAICVMEDLVVLTRASEGCSYFLLFHFAKELRSFVLGQEVRKVALVGFEDSAIPVSIDKDPLLVSKENFKAPKFEMLKEMKSEDEVIAKMPARSKAEKMRIRNLITIRPCIMETIVRGEAGLFADAFMTVLGTVKSKDIIDSGIQEMHLISVKATMGIM
eukprot:4879006-Ditylum_brightwellii.AAC.1